MDRVIQIQVIEGGTDNPGVLVNIFALTDDGRLLIRPTRMAEYKVGEWAELTFPPKKVPKNPPVEYSNQRIVKE